VQRRVTLIALGVGDLGLARRIYATFSPAP